MFTRSVAVRTGSFATALLVSVLAPRSAQAEETEETKERLTRFVVAAAEVSHDRRVVEGSESLGIGVALAGAGVASWATASEPSARKSRDVVGAVFVGFGGVMVLAGAVSLLAPSTLEERRDAFFAAVRTQPGSFDVAVAEFERALFAAEKSAKVERTATAVGSFVFGALELGGGIALEVAATDPGLKWLGRGLMAGGVGSAIVGGGALAVRSETERLADQWRRERTLPDAKSRPALSVVPQLGIGSVGVTGTF
jgi:hypothetical protein